MPSNDVQQEHLLEIVFQGKGFDLSFGGEETWGKTGGRACSTGRFEVRGVTSQDQFQCPVYGGRLQNVKDVKDLIMEKHGETRAGSGPPARGRVGWQNKPMRLISQHAARNMKQHLPGKWTTTLF